jgi:hypothetical protein
MCLAAYKPKGVEIAKQYLRSGYYSNCSGCGFMYHDRGQLHVVKGLMTFNEFYKKVQEAGQKEHDMAFHWRAATHGPVSDENCHPYEMCDGKWAVLHNGICTVPMKLKHLSDSGNFAHSVLQPAILDGTYKDVKRMKNHPQWGWGAMVLMGGSGEVIIYNEEMGRWDKDLGAWFSNGAYQYDGYSNNIYMDRMDEQGHKPNPRPAHMFLGDDGY